MGYDKEESKNIKVDSLLKRPDSLYIGSELQEHEIDYETASAQGDTCIVKILNGLHAYRWCSFHNRLKVVCDVDAAAPATEADLPAVPAEDK